MQLVGYKRLTIQVLDKDLNPVAGEKFVIEGKTGGGATSKFSITGLSKTAVKVSGSNIVYYVAQKGLGDVAANFGILDIPFDDETTILGHVTSANGVVHMGEKSDPPFCAVLAESEDLTGQKVGFGLYAGKFGKGEVSAETLKHDADFTPAPEDFTFAPIGKEFDDGNHTVGVGVDTEAFTALVTELFGTPAEA